MRDLAKNCILFLVFTILSKFINDNLPDLSFKSLKQYTNVLHIRWWVILSLLPLLVNWHIMTIDNADSQTLTLLLVFLLGITAMADFLMYKRKVFKKQT